MKNGILTKNQADEANGIPSHFIDYLRIMGMLDQLDEETHKLTYAGWTVVKLVRTGIHPTLTE